MASSRRSAAGITAFALLVYVPIMLTAPGQVAADTKSYPYLDPDRFIGRISSLRDPNIGMGTVTHQNLGYLFPPGPFYWLTHGLLGVPAWVAEQLWLDATCWAVSARATARGYDPLQVNGGFEWVAYHRKVGPLQGDTAAERQRLRARYYRGLCVTVVVEPASRGGGAGHRARRGPGAGARPGADRGGPQHDAVLLGRIRLTGLGHAGMVTPRRYGPTTSPPLPRRPRGACAAPCPKGTPC